MMAADPPPELSQALHDWHAALARGDRQARLAARLLVDILVAGGLDERLEEIQARQPRAQPVPPNPERQEALLDDILRLATQNVTISAELYRRLAVQEQRIAEIHAASQAAQALLQPCARLVKARRRLTDHNLAAARRPDGRYRPSPPRPPASIRRPPVPDLIRLLRLLAAIGVLLLAAAWLAVAVGKAACPQPIRPLLPLPAARMLVPPAELPPEPRPRREEPADAI